MVSSIKIKDKPETITKNGKFKLKFKNYTNKIIEVEFAIIHKLYNYDSLFIKEHEEKTINYVYTKKYTIHDLTN